MSEATHDLDAVLEQAEAWKAAGRGVALATVVRTWGSSPRPAGSKLAVNDGGEFVGSVSGGCIEAAVITEALEVMAGDAPRVLSFGVSDETAWDVGLACGGKVDVFVEARDVNRALLAELRAARAAGRAVVLATRLDGWRPAPGRRGRRAGRARRRGGAGAPPGPGRGRRHRRRRRSCSSRSVPPLRLILVGAVHVAQPLAQMAALAGFA